MTPEILRTVVIALGAVTIGAILAVVRLHWRAWRLTPCRKKRLVPRHVWEVATAHGVLVLGITWAMVDSIGSPEYPSWRVILYIAAMVLTLLALRDVGVSQRRKAG